MGDTLIFDLVARDKSVTSTFNSAAKAGEKLASKLDDAGKGISKSLDKAGQSGIQLERSANGTVKAWDSASKLVSKSFDTAASKIASDLAKIEQEAWESGRGMDKALSSSLDGLRSKLQQLHSDAARTGAALDSDLGGALREVKQEAGKLSTSIKGDLKEVEDAGEKAGEGLGQSLTEGLSSVLDKSGGGPLAGLLSSFSGAKLGIVGAGLAIGGLLMDGIADAIERNKVGALVAAQTGQVSGAASRMGNIAGDLFANSFGDSVQDVGTALTAVFQNKLIDPTAADAAIAAITGKIMTVSDVMDEEADKVSRAARTMLVNGVATNITQALDMITHATQTGLNSAGDLLDTIDEYSIQFNRMGLSGQESFGLLGQALKAGARDTDIAADAVKEFGIRAQDGSDLTRRGFSAIGLDAKVMGERVAAGGQSAHDALRDTLNALQAMPPGVERSTAAVDLFGTKAEDMGEALYHMDLDNAAAQFGDFAGSVQEAANSMSEGVTGAERLGKGFDNAKADVGNFLGDLGNLGVGDDMQAMVDKANMVGLALEKWQSSGSTEWIDQVKQKFPELSGAIDQYVAKHQGEVDANHNVTASVQEQVDTLDELIAKKQEAAGITLGVREAESAYQAAIDAATESVEKNGKAHGFNTEKGRENNAALDDIAKTALTVAASMAADGRSTDAVNKKMGAARAQFMSTARSMGYTKGEAAALATKLGLIPGDYKAQVRALGIAAAKSSVQGLINRLDNIPRSVNVMVNVHGNEMAARGIPTGGFQRRASGGPVKANELYRVGEEGEEWFVPKQDGMIIPHNAARAAAAMLSPHGPGGRSAQAQQTVVHMHIHGSGTMAQAIMADVRTGKIRFVADGKRVTVG